MPKIPVALALCVATFAASAQSAVSPVAAYKGALAAPYMACASAYHNARLDQRLDGMAAAQARHNYGTPIDGAAQGAAAITAGKAFADCKAAARAKALDAYKAFAAGVPDGKLKADGREALAAWLAFLGAATGDMGVDTRSNAWSAYLKTLAEMDLDASGV